MVSVSGSSLSKFKVFAIKVGGLALSSYHKLVYCCQGKRSISAYESFREFLSSSSLAAASLNSFLFDGSFVVSYGSEFSFSGSVDFL